jgi:hypothetical protein
MTMQESAFGHARGLGHLPDDSAFSLVGLGRRPLMPAPPGLGTPAGLGAVIVSESMVPPSATSVPGPSVAPLCASCSTLNGGIAATSMAADQALREEGCIAGLGQEPEGLGAAPSSLQVLGTLPAQCQHWLLAFVNGSRKANVIIHGRSFGYQSTLNYFANLYGGRTVYFAFTNNKGTYIFAYENVNGVHAIKICTDGYFVARTPNGKAPFTVYPPSPVTPVAGLGQVFSTQAPLTPGMGNTSITIIPHVVSGTFVPAFTCDASGLNATLVSGAPDMAQYAMSDMQNAQVAQLVQQFVSGHGVASDHRLYFGFQDNNPPNWAQTPGEPTGMAIMRIFEASPGLYQIGLCISESGIATTSVPGPSVAPSGGGVPQFSGQVPINVAPTLPIQTGNPPSPGLWWWQAMWIYWAPSGSGLPGTPPAGLIPPNQPVSPTGEVGKWVQTSSGHWDWFPPGTQGTPYGLVVGGDGVTYGVYASSGAATGDAGTSTSSLAPPSTAPPQLAAGTTGQWINPHPDYYIFIATGVPATTTSTSWIWWLLGLTVVGGGAAYYFLD